VGDRSSYVVLTGDSVIIINARDDDNDYNDVCVCLSVCRNVLLLDFNHILPVGLHCMESITADTDRQQLNKTQFNIYRQTEAEYFSVSYTHTPTGRARSGTVYAIPQMPYHRPI